VLDRYRQVALLTLFPFSLQEHFPLPPHYQLTANQTKSSIISLTTTVGSNATHNITIITKVVMLFTHYLTHFNLKFNLIQKSKTTKNRKQNQIKMTRIVVWF
jgi:hypothetical protein